MLKKIPLEQMERKANQPGTRRVAAKAHRGTRVRIYRNGRENTPPLAPSDRKAKSFGHVRPDEVEQGYQVKFREER